MKRVPVWLKNNKRKLDIRSFARNHGHLLTIVGALVVFATFMVREGFKEQLKNFVDSTVAVQNDFEMELERSETPAAFNRIEWALERISAETGKEKDGNRQLTRNEERQLVARQRLERIENVLSQMLIIMNKLPVYDRVIRDAILNEVKQALDDAVDIGLDAEQPDALSIRDPRERTAALLKNWESVDRRSKEVKKTIEDIWPKIWKYSEAIREKEERQLRICTWASYGIYILGWGLALAGKLFGNSLSTGE